jgi:hypothetical protein
LHGAEQFTFRHIEPAIAAVTVRPAVMVIDCRRQVARSVRRSRSTSTTPRPTPVPSTTRNDGCGTGPIHCAGGEGRNG